MAKALNKLYVVIDTYIENRESFNNAIVSKIYKSIRQPKIFCARKNRADSEALGLETSNRYAVAQINISEIPNTRTTYIEEVSIEDTPWGKGENRKIKEVAYETITKK